MEFFHNDWEPHKSAVVTCSLATICTASDLAILSIRVNIDILFSIQVFLVSILMTRYFTLINTNFRYRIEFGYQFTSYRCYQIILPNLLELLFIMLFFLSNLLPRCVLNLCSLFLSIYLLPTHHTKGGLTANIFIFYF